MTSDSAQQSLIRTPLPSHSLTLPPLEVVLRISLSPIPIFTMNSTTAVQKKVDTTAATDLLVSTCQKLSIGADNDDIDALVDRLNEHLHIVDLQSAKTTPDVPCFDVEPNESYIPFTEIRDQAYYFGCRSLLASVIATFLLQSFGRDDPGEREQYLMLQCLAKHADDLRKHADDLYKETLALNGGLQTETIAWQRRLQDVYFIKLQIDDGFNKAKRMKSTLADIEVYCMHNGYDEVIEETLRHVMGELQHLIQELGIDYFGWRREQMAIVEDERMDKAEEEFS